MAEIDKTLKERSGEYGDFTVQFPVAQNIKDAMKLDTNWEELSKVQKEALEMIATKISRILTGNPDYHDNWHDIVGYTKLIADSLEVK